MVYTIEDIKKKAYPIAKKYGVDTINLFGSYARGEATDESDIDFYIDKGQITNLFLYSGFIQDLEDTFDCHVDVVTTTINDKKFLQAIMKEGILVYEK